LKMPLGGRSTTVLTVGLKGPSAPVLPLSKARAPNGAKLALTANAMAMALVLMGLLLSVIDADFEMNGFRMVEVSFIPAR